MSVSPATTGLLRVVLLAAATLGLAAPLRAETVVERAARTGVLTMGGRADLIPSAYVDDQQQLVGYSIDVGRRIAAELSRYLGKPVELDYQVENDAQQLFTKVRLGEVDLACGTQFTWEREMFSDFTIPYSLSGIRVLAREGSLDGSADSLRGRRIGVLAGSLGDSTIATLQPQARRVPFTSVDDALVALVGGRVDALAGDSLILAGTIQRHAREGYALVPERPYTRYAVGCLIPENDATFRNLANLSIASLLQGYVSGEPTATELVGRWVGPSGIVEIPAEMVRAFFETVLLNHEPVSLPGQAPDAN